ncbi:hypothetical protein ANCCEY_10474 [Ancylostoma ceylanicum]|uniref:Reverse transcriptase domain-containing protein n=1 Tax=Ancylostoma ceylanicum TaxID=53326 RepID=A0A0D6LER6_9BILA|nr:hypothetical protein ANCCEY_10474 [Ancylostoma ceylanicum]
MSRLNWDDKGLTIDGKKLSNLRFADDIVLISHNTPEMNQLLNELNEAGKAIGLEMNLKKTQMMANQWCDDREVQLDGITLKKVDSYVYLGREMKRAFPNFDEEPFTSVQKTALIELLSQHCGMTVVRTARTCIKEMSRGNALSPT